MMRTSRRRRNYEDVIRHLEARPYRNRCSCGDMAHDRECRIEGTYHLEARALYVGTICDACALTHYSNVVTGVGDWSMTEDSQGFRVRVENHMTGEIIADFYGPTRNISARALLWEQCRRDWSKPRKLWD